MHNIISLQNVTFTGLVSSLAILTIEGASLVLVGHPPSDAVTIKKTYVVDVLLHQPASHPIFCYWIG